MHIDPREKFAGVPILTVRTLLKKLVLIEDSEEVAQEYLRMPPSVARTVIEKLEKEKYIERDDVYWKLTDKGSRFKNSPASRPIHRKTADRKIMEFLERVRHVRDNPFYLYKVQKVAVFGSYLSDASRLGDIDLAIDLIGKGDGDEFRELCEKKTRRAERLGRVFSWWFKREIWPREEVFMFLKNRSTAIRLHPTAGTIWKSNGFKVIYEDPS